MKKKTTTMKTSEVYTAYENPEDIAVDDMNLNSTVVVVRETAPEPKPARKALPISALEERVAALEKKLAAQEEAPAVSTTEKLAEKAVEKPAEKPKASVFFDVPTERKATIAKRLKLVEAILLKSGRAYDYRSLTTKQLEEILAALQPQKVTPLSE